MIAGLQKVYPIIPHEIDEPVLLSEAARPRAWSEVFEGFRFSDAGKGTSENGFNEIKCSQCNAAIRLHPVAQIFSELRVKYRIISHPEALHPGAVLLSFAASQSLQALD